MLESVGISRTVMVRDIERERMEGVRKKKEKRGKKGILLKKKKGCGCYGRRGMSTELYKLSSCPALLPIVTRQPDRSNLS